MLVNPSLSPPVEVNQAPIAKITLSKNQQVHIGEAFTFSAADSEDSNKDELTYQWSLFASDNKELFLDDATAKDITVTFTAEGGHRTGRSAAAGASAGERARVGGELGGARGVAGAKADAGVELGLARRVAVDRGPPEGSHGIGWRASRATLGGEGARHSCELGEARGVAGAKVDARLELRLAQGRARAAARARGHRIRGDAA